MRLSHAQTSPQNRKNITVNSIPKQCLLYLLYVRLQSQSSAFLHPLVWGLPGLGDGIHIALLLLRGSAK